MLEWIEAVIKANQEAASATSPNYWKNRQSVRSKKYLLTGNLSLFCIVMALSFLLLRVLLFP